MKTYTAKSSAHRAAKQAGLTKDQYEIIEIDGQFGYRLLEEDPSVMEPVQEEPAAEVTEQLEAVQQPAVEPATEEVKPAKAKLEVKHRSEIPRPTKTVWHIADQMHAENPNVRRKDVIAECVRRGIAYYTARTQYQQWLAARKGAF